MCNTRINYKTNKFLFFGAIANFLFLFSRVFDNFPDIISGFLVGIAIVGYFLGFYSVNHDISKLTDKKKSLLLRSKK